MLTARPLRSAGITPFLRYYGPIRLPCRIHLQLCFPVSSWASFPSCRASQVPQFVFPHTPSPYTPESPVVAFSHFLHHRSWLRHLREVGRSHLSIEADPGSLSLRLALSPFEASSDRITPTYARLATWLMGFFHDELLSVH